MSYPGQPFSFQTCPSSVKQKHNQRKGDCAWSCSRWQTQPEQICKLQSTNQFNVRSEWHWFVRCDLQIFSGCICYLEQLHAQSPFLYPIVFGINIFCTCFNLKQNFCSINWWEYALTFRDPTLTEWFLDIYGQAAVTYAYGQAAVTYVYIYGQAAAAVAYRFPSDHQSQAPSSEVSTWMGDHPGTPRAVGNTWCTGQMAKPRPQVARGC